VKNNIKNDLKTARLIPSFADSEREQRATSILLACFRIVPDFANEVLREVGAPISKRSQISSYTEVVFKNDNKTNKASRIDGLIVIKSGSKIWSAIVESKIGSEGLTKQQIEEYLDIAKLNGVNTLITISNQYATTPTHNPVQVSKQKTKSTDLFHFSWLSIQTNATLLFKNKVVNDREQAMIISELIQYLKDPRSGVTSFTQMGKGWREVSLAVNKGIKLKKNEPEVENAISSWQQFSKYLSIKLSDHVGQPVFEYISRSRIKDPSVNYQVNLDDLINSNYLDAEFEIPNASSRLYIKADLKLRTITIQMSLDAPQDRTYPQACINWLTRQISNLREEDIEIRANWSRGITKMEKLSNVLDDPISIIPEGIKDLPKTLDVVKIVDLAGKFSSSKPFVEETTNSVLNFYNDVGANLRKWNPKPLKGKGQVNKAINYQKNNPFSTPQI